MSVAPPELNLLKHALGETVSSRPLLRDAGLRSVASAGSVLADQSQEPVEDEDLEPGKGQGHLVEADEQLR